MAEKATGDGRGGGRAWPVWVRRRKSGEAGVNLTIHPCWRLRIDQITLQLPRYRARGEAEPPPPLLPPSWKCERLGGGRVGTRGRRWRRSGSAMGTDVEKMIAVGLVWGATNAAMRRGAQLWDQKLRGIRRNGENGGHPLTPIHQRFLRCVREWVELILIWQYSVPFLVNLSASAAFFYILGSAPISIAVPVTNAVTFAATAVSAMLLGEKTRVGHALLGTVLIVLGVWVCIL
ncbi:hypothetical protein Taro_053795 [Colocasia esculenta]|uniref:Transmembrane protein 234 homolog n=1 Tax=Colocasia esculenta TaxID=4460 RepID=A0A843XP98_COLES|nr:hypothetical protein [Colocasia esculenta]